MLSFFRVPSIRVSNSQGLTTTEIKQLLEILKEKAEGLKGQQMILELCLVCKEYLESRNRRSDTSVHESMLKQKAMVEIEQKVASRKVISNQRNI